MSEESNTTPVEAPAATSAPAPESSGATPPTADNGWYDEAQGAAASAAGGTIPQTTSAPSSGDGDIPTLKTRPPVDTPSASPGAAPAPAYTATPVKGPVPLQPVRRSGLGGLVDEIRDALAGKTTGHVYTDADGNKFIRQDNLTHGQQWLRIASTAIRGAGAGMVAGKGTGGAGAALAAGVEKGVDVGQQHKKEQNELQDRTMKENMDRYNTLKLKHDVAGKEFELGRMKVAATESDVKYAQTQQDREKSLGSIDLGAYSNAYTLADVRQQHPDFWKDAYAGRIQAVPEISADGKRLGVRLFLRAEGVNDQIAPDGTKALFFVPSPKPGEPPKLEERTLSGPNKQSRVDDLNNAAQSQMQAWQINDTKVKEQQAAAKLKEAEAQSEPAKREKMKAEANEANAKAQKARAEAKVLNEAQDSVTIQSNAHQLVDGTIDPANLSKRAKSYDRTLAEANAYSMQKYGKPFNVAKAAGDYKFATNVGTTNLLNYLNSLTGRDDRSGNLQKIVEMSDKLPRGEFPPLNAVSQWAKLETGHPEVAAYRAALLEVSDQVAKILQGGGSGGGGGTSDAKIKQSMEILNKNFTAKQIQAVANGALRPLLANRKYEIIGDNRYLAQWHGPQQQAQPAAPAGGKISIQPGEPTAMAPDGKSTMVVRNGQWVIAQ